MNFKSLLKKYKIIIPEIQRSYAQGRTDSITKVKRDKFLSVLSAPGKKELNFIYGVIKSNGDEDVFFPMDGQQRLTTLFLLHLYKAIKDEDLDDFLGVVFPCKNLRFRYETMPSGNIFLSNLLSDTNLLQSLKDQKNISENIRYSYWYKYDWNKNPTIKGMLVMLDAMHEKKMDTLSYSDLDNISFEFIDIAEISRRINSDDLFIKINSTGKLLTSWEILKAKINHEISINTEIDDKISPKLFIDNEFMSACKKILMIATEKDNITIKDISDIEKIAKNIYIAALKDKKEMNIFYFLKVIHALYKFYCTEDKEISELPQKRKNLIKKDIAEGLYSSSEDSLSYPLRLRLSIIELFYSSQKDLHGDLWRIIYNILENTNYPDSEDSLSYQIESFSNIISWNIDTEILDIEQKGLYPSRVLKEEIAKYTYYRHLSSQIEYQEKHEYFKGLLSPVFILCGVDVNNNKYPNLETFEKEIYSINEIFPYEKGKHFSNTKFFKDGLLERSMLFYSNILFKRRALHMENDRDCSWSKFFSYDDNSDNHREVFKKLVENQFTVEPEDLTLNFSPWTKYIYFLSDIYTNNEYSEEDFCFQYDKRYVHTFYLNDEEYHALLSKSQLNGRHVDLLLYTLFKYFDMTGKWSVIFSYYKDYLSTLRLNSEQENIYILNKVIDGKNVVYLLSEKELPEINNFKEKENSFFADTYVAILKEYCALSDLAQRNWHFYKCADIDSFKKILDLFDLVPKI